MDRLRTSTNAWAMILCRKDFVFRYTIPHNTPMTSRGMTMIRLLSVSEKMPHINGWLAANNAVLKAIFAQLFHGKCVSRYFRQ